MNFFDSRLASAPAATGATRDAMSLSQVFRCAAPVAAAGSVLALFLREVRLRNIHHSPVDIGDGFGMLPTADTPERLLENATARMLGGEIGMRLRSIWVRPHCFGTAWLTGMGGSFRIPVEVLEPTVDRLLLTPTGCEQGPLCVCTAAGLDL